MLKNRVIIIAAFFISLSVFSQKKWMLKECVDQALERNISVQQSKLRVALSKGDVAIAKGNFLPNLSGSTRGNLNFGSGFDPVTNDRVSTSTFGGSIGLSSNLTVFNGYRNSNIYKQAQLGVESSVFDLEKIENDVTLLVANGYLNVLFAKENVNVAKVQYEISIKQIEAARVRFQAGSIAKGELLNVESTAASNLQTLTTQENALNLALLNLSQTLQIPSLNFDVAPIDIAAPSSNLLYEKSDIVYENSLKNRPEIERAKLAIENADLNIKITEANFMPSISLQSGVSTNYGYNLNLPAGFNNTEFITQLDNNLGIGIGFNVNIPIFNRNQTKNNVLKAQINKEISETNLENEKVQLRQTIEQAFLDVKASLKSYEAANISLIAQKEAFKNAQESYNVGAMTLFDFDQVRNRLVNAEAALIRSKYDYVFKTKILQFYSGELSLD